MTINVSTKFKELILGPNSFADIFDGGRIYVYSGIQPANADLPVVGTLLAEVTTNGTAWTYDGPGGLTFEPYDAWVLKSQTVTWKLKVVANGTPSWFRLVGKDADDGTGRTDKPRLDGSISDTAPTDLVIPATNLTEGEIYTVQQFSFTFYP